MTVIYIKEQGSSLRRRGEQIVVTKGSQTLLEFPIHHVDSIVVLGNVQITRDLEVLLLTGMSLSKSLPINTPDIYVQEEE